VIYLAEKSDLFGRKKQFIWQKNVLWLTKSEGSYNKTPISYKAP